jgi:hypothetical protein
MNRVRKRPKKEYEFTFILTADPDEEEADRLYGPLSSTTAIPVRS